MCARVSNVSVKYVSLKVKKITTIENVTMNRKHVCLCDLGKIRKVRY